MSEEVGYGEGRFWSFSLRKNLVYSFIVLIVLLFVLIFVSYLVNVSRINTMSSVETCGDGGFVGTCSINKPYYCSSDGQLVRNSNFCGCPFNSSKVNGDCYSSYSVAAKEINLRYLLDGKENSFSFSVYGGLDNYLSSLDQSIKYQASEISSRADFKLDKINEDVQREFLMPLVVEIQNRAPDNKDDQARIAISLVQNIPYGQSDKTYSFAGQEVPYSRYPYQVLYDNEGICGEKTELLSFLLREIGYGVSFFYYLDENHEALGIKCPVYESFSNTGYCFIETTAPSIIGDSGINYVDLGNLYSDPELFFISEGLTFGEDNFYEVRDAKRLNRIRSFIDNYGWIGPLRRNLYDRLKIKYKLVDEYYGE